MPSTNQPVRPGLCLRALPLLLLALLVVACEDTIVNPFIDDDRFFSIYGALDTGAFPQMIRVVPIRDRIGIGETEIDARVTTTAREDGVTVVWSDSLIQYKDGSLGHVFHAPFRPIPGWTYDIAVERSDGATTRATTTIPFPPNVQIDDPSGISIISQRVVWNDIDYNPYRVEIYYRFFNEEEPQNLFQTALLTYRRDRFGKLTDDGWEVIVGLMADKEAVMEQLGFIAEAMPMLVGIGIRLTMADDQWRPPDGVFDPEVLVQPGTFSNVENGFGFFGSLNQFTAEWTLSSDVTRILGYSFPGEQ
jgi:hypothetical protein